jgi:hypothetical protein
MQLVIAHRHPLRPALEAKNQHAAIDRMECVGLGQFLCQFKSEFRVGEQPAVFAFTSFYPDYKVGIEAFAIFEYNLHAPGLVRLISMSPTHNFLCVAIQ